MNTNHTENLKQKGWNFQTFQSGQLGADEEVLLPLGVKAEENKPDQSTNNDDQPLLPMGVTAKED